MLRLLQLNIQKLKAFHEILTIGHVLLTIGHVILTIGHVLLTIGHVILHILLSIIDYNIVDYKLIILPIRKLKPLCPIPFQIVKFQLRHLNPTISIGKNRLSI